MRINSVSIIIPCYNEERTIAAVLEKIQLLDIGEREKDIIVINDGSTDNTGAIIDRFAKQFRVIHQSSNQGKGQAVLLGASVALGEYLIVQDADLETDPQDILKLISIAEERNLPVVLGSRSYGGVRATGWHPLYFLGGKGVTSVVNVLFGTACTDVPAVYKLIRSDLFRTLPLRERGFACETELVSLLAARGYPLVETLISYTPRTTAEGKKLRFVHGIQAVSAAVRVFFIEHPLRQLYRRLRRFFGRYEKEILLFSLAVAASFMVFALMSHFNPERMNHLDSAFASLAKNMRLHGIYADDDVGAPPLYPHSAYTPLYPITLIPFVGHPVGALMFNWVLHAFLVVLLYRFAVYRFNVPGTVAFILSALFVLEPYHLVLTNTITAEMLFTVCLFGCVYTLLRYVERTSVSIVAAVMGMLGITILVRPSAEFLVPLVPLATVYLLWGQWKRIVVHIGVGSFVCLFVLFPWLYRNHRLYGLWSLSSLPAQQMLNAGMPHYLEWKERGRAATEQGIFERLTALKREASERIGKDITNRFTIDVAEARPVMREMVVPFLRTHWVSFTGFYLTQLPFQMITDNWRTALENMTRLPQRGVMSLSTALSVVRGDFSQLRATVSFVDAYLITFILGKLYWLCVYVLALYGSFIAWRRGGMTRLLMLLSLALVFYFPLTSLPYLEARYRFPGTPFLFALAMVGVAAVFQKWRSLFRQLYALKTKSL